MCFGGGFIVGVIIQIANNKSRKNEKEKGKCLFFFLLSDQFSRYTKPHGLADK